MANTGGPTTGRPPPRGVRCFECNWYGHFARDCVRRRDVSSETDPQTSEESSACNFVEGSTYAYLPVTVNGRRTAVLIDIGSELSLAPSAFVRPADIIGSTQLLKAANGTEIRVLGETTLRGKVDDVFFQIPCLVTEQLSEMIFGLEFLEKHHAYWDFTNRSIRLNGRAFPLQRQPKGVKCRKIVVAADTKVPAFS